ncbi:MAG: InlB B-repeat-containing protein [Clostridia bacterium]|nr:InlB B-repeat-containing protein [Clostridia bacterium]
MKKKLFLTALLALMMMSAVACGKREEDSSVQPPVTSENSELSEAPETSEKPESSEAPETSEKPESSEGGEKEEIYYTVTFDSDGGSEVASITILAGGKVSKPTNPQKSSSLSEYEFLYW